MERLVKDEYKMHFAWSPYIAINERYGNILRGDDDLSVTLKRLMKSSKSSLLILWWIVTISKPKSSLIEPCGNMLGSLTLSNRLRY